MASTVYRCLSTNNFYDGLLVHVGFSVDSVLSQTKLEHAANQLIRTSPILGGSFIKGKPYSHTFGTAVDFKARTVDRPKTIIFGRTKIDGQHVLDEQSANVYDRLFWFDLESMKTNIFALRVTFLENKTLLGFSMAHSVADAQSVFHVVSSYCELLKGNTTPRIHLPPDAQGVLLSDLVEDSADQDDVKSAKHASRSDHEGVWRIGAFAIIRGFFRMFKVAVSTTLGVSASNERLVVIPHEWLSSLKQQEFQSCVATGQISEHDIPFSRNDLLFAMLLKGQSLYESSSSSSPRKQVNAVGIFNYRQYLANAWAEAFYLYNHAAASSCNFAMTDLKDRSLGWIASRLRESLFFFRSASSVKAYLQYQESTPSSIKTVDSATTAVFMSSWATFDFGNLDFSGGAAKSTVSAL